MWRWGRFSLSIIPGCNISMSRRTANRCLMMPARGISRDKYKYNPILDQCDMLWRFLCGRAVEASDTCIPLADHSQPPPDRLQWSSDGARVLLFRLAGGAPSGQNSFWCMCSAIQCDRNTTPHIATSNSKSDASTGIKKLRLSHSAGASFLLVTYWDVLMSQYRWVSFGK